MASCHSLPGSTGHTNNVITLAEGMGLAQGARPSVGHMLYLCYPTAAPQHGSYFPPGGDGKREERLVEAPVLGGHCATHPSETESSLQPRDRSLGLSSPCKDGEREAHTCYAVTEALVGKPWWQGVLTSQNWVWLWPLPPSLPAMF